MENRIIELESKIAFFERNVQELNDVIYAQQKQIDKLEKKLKVLSDTINSANDDSGGAVVNEKPPHY